jgi:uncharacterized protein (TIGR03083 family)
VTADNSAAGLTAQLEEEWTALEELGAGLDDTDWVRPTPCPGWDVAAQFAHIIGTESMLLGRPRPDDVDVDTGRPAHVRNDIGGFNETWVAALAPLPRQEVLAQLSEVLTARRQAIEAMTEEEFSAPANTPIGPADYRRFMQIRVFDCWVHEQDVRDAITRPGHEGGAVVEQTVDEIVRALGFIVGKRAAAPDGSSVTFELTGPVVRTIHIAVDGRAAVVDRLPGAATATIALGSRLFTRLACGRVDPAEKLAEVHLAGDTDLGRRVVTSLPFTV